MSLSLATGFVLPLLGLGIFGLIGRVAENSRLGKTNSRQVRVQSYLGCMNPVWSRP